MQSDSTWATIVLYYPDETTVEYIAQLSSWINLVVVDNTPCMSTRKMFGKEQYIVNGKNLGIAAALNQGMKFAQSRGASWCLLLDQDSRLSKVDIETLIIQRNSLNSKRLAILAPVYYCSNVGRFGDAISFEYGRLKRCAISSNSFGSKLYPADYVISSGSLVNLSVCEEIGWHNEELFIDFVDIDWGLRAKRHGYDIFLTNDVCMKHTIGDKPISIGKLKVVNHSPLRHYYYFRNVFFMLRKKHVPLDWKVREVVKLPIRFILYAGFTEQRLSHIKYMTKGMLHGIRGRFGAL